MNLNKTTKNTSVLVVLVLLVAGIAAVAPAAALKVDGARIALDVDAGKTYTSPIGISIGATEAEGDFAVAVSGFGQTNDGTYTALDAAADTAPTSARPFITVDKPTVHLKPGERAAVTATIAIPAGTAAGGRYAIIMVRPAAASTGAPAAFATAVAIPVFLTVKGGKVTGQGEILSVDTGKVEPATAFTVTTVMRNSGIYHYYGALSNVSITDKSGKQLAAGKTDPLVRAIIPGQQVEFRAAVPGGLPEGFYTITDRMEMEDGTLLATKTTELQVGNPKPAAGSTAAETPQGTDASARATYAPGPGMPVICIAAALGILGGRRITGKRKK